MMKIFLTNLGRYNEGALIGKWVELPCDDLTAELEEIGVADGTAYEEYVITDWECDIQGLEISEYSNINALNEMAEKLEDVDNLELVSALMEEFGYDLDEAIERADDVFYLQLDKDTYNDEENLAYTYIDSIGSLECAVGSNIDIYFDYEAFGRDLQYDLDSMLEDYEEEEREAIENMSSEELAEWYVEGFGNVSELGKETLERYFDYEKFGRDLSYDFSINQNTMLAICNN